jgi:hypothetical protein
MVVVLNQVSSITQRSGGGGRYASLSAIHLYGGKDLSAIPPPTSSQGKLTLSSYFLDPFTGQFYPIGKFLDFPVSSLLNGIFCQEGSFLIFLPCDGENGGLGNQVLLFYIYKGDYPGLVI